MNHHPRTRTAFTLLEMLMTITIVAVATALVMPVLQDDTDLRLQAASGIVISDLELAQVLTIAHPDAPSIVRFADDGASYWIADADDPETPSPRAEDGTPYLVTFGAGRAAAATGVTVLVDDMVGNRLVYNAQGGLADVTASPVIWLSLGDRWVRLAVTATTGSIVESFGEGEIPPRPDPPEDPPPDDDPFGGFGGFGGFG